MLEKYLPNGWAQRFSDLFALTKDVWQQGFAGASIGQLISAALILILGFLVRRLFARVAVGYLLRLTQKTKTKADDVILQAIKEPVAFIPIVISIYLAIQMLPISGAFLEFTYNFERSLVAFTIFWMLHAATKPLAVNTLKPGRLLTLEMVNWIGKALRFTFVALGAAVILEIWGIKVAPLLAGLGLFGVAVALGAQDLFKNLIAGLFLIAERRFHVGEWVKVEGLVEGTVEQIGFRTTTIRRFDKAPVFVPNAKLSDSAVINFSGMTQRRIYWHIGVTYGTTTEQLKAICDGIQNRVSGDEDFAQPPIVPIFVRVDKFGASSIDIMLYCFTRTTNWGEWLAIKEKLALDIKTIVEDAGSSFAFPSTSVYLETMPDPAATDNGPERLVPPQSGDKSE